MKCGYCNGTGEHINDANRMTTCEFCGGTGVIKPLTNEEWMKQCNTEQLAEWFVSTNRCKKDHLCSVCKQKWCDKKYVVEWLKQPHIKE